MSGGGGGGPFYSRTPSELAQQLRRAQDETSIRAFEVELNGFLSNLLATANSRDAELAQERLDQIKGALREQLEKAIDSLFGGSVAKHTYVDGLSDIDSLLILDGSNLEGASPAQAINKVADILQNELETVATVSAGRLAVTVEYRDGMQIQLLPAFRSDDKIKVPSFRHEGWSGISPESFQSALTTRNTECGGKLVPTIKLAKAIIGTLPDSQRLSGYHIESLAIAAFRNYSGPKTTAAMLPLFFEKARELVATPIRDRTGQSLHVDDYLGTADSKERVAASHVLNRIAKRMRHANAHMSKEQWEAMFGSIND